LLRSGSLYRIPRAVHGTRLISHPQRHHPLFCSFIFTYYFFVSFSYHFYIFSDIVFFLLLSYYPSLSLLTFARYMHQVPRYAYTGTCAAFTLLVVCYGQFDDVRPDVWYATMRILHILMGLFAVIIASSVIFPQSSIVNFQKVFLKTSVAIATLTSPIVEQVIIYFFPFYFFFELFFF